MTTIEPTNREAIQPPLATRRAAAAEQSAPILEHDPARVARRRAEGCLTVEMECSAFCAVARFRRVTLGRILYGGDDVSGVEWDRRGWDRQTGVRRRLLHLAAEACLRTTD